MKLPNKGKKKKKLFVQVKLWLVSLIIPKEKRKEKKRK